MLLKTRPNVHDPLPDGRTNPSLTQGALYVAVNAETDNYRVVDDSGEPIIFPTELFDVIDDYVPADWIHYHSEDLSWFYFGPLEVAGRGFFERWHDRHPETRRIFAKVYFKLWKHYSAQLGQEEPLLKRD